MTAFYGSQRVPKDVFGEGAELATFYQVLTDKAPGCWALNTLLLALWDPEASVYEWILPDNFHARIKVFNTMEEEVTFLGRAHSIFREVNMPAEEGRSLSANLVHSIDGFIVRELLRRCYYDPAQINQIHSLIQSGTCTRKGTKEDESLVLTLWDLYGKTGYLSARILDHLDARTWSLVDPHDIAELVHSLPRRPFPILPVHDMFRVHPNYGNDLRRQYNLQLHLLAKSTLLQHLLNFLTKRPLKVNKLADFSQEILRTNYSLS